MTKVISISDTAYKELSNLKRDLSFSEIILALTKIKKKESIADFAGKLDKKKWDKISKELREERKTKSRRME